MKNDLCEKCNVGIEEAPGACKYICCPLKGKESNYTSKNKTSHPWGDFLDARVRVILWMKNEMGYNDKHISEALSMDEKQVFLIRTHFEKKREG